MLHYDLVPSAGVHMLVLHGLGDSRHGWKSVAPMLGLDGVGWIFVEAPDRYFDGFSWFGLALPDLKPVERDVLRSRELLRELLDHLERERGIPCERIVLLGFSQGCLMAMDLALRHGRRFASVVGLSGWVAFIDEYPAGLGPAAKTQRFLMAHGEADPVVPISATRPQAERLKAMGLDLTWCTYPGLEHGLDPEDELEDLRAFLRPALRPVRQPDDHDPRRSAHEPPVQQGREGQSS